MQHAGAAAALELNPPLKLGPEGFDKIAIIGSAPSSVRLAPYGDKTWAIWGCSPGAYGEIPYGRSDVFFELHRWEPSTAGDPRDPANKPWFSPEYVRFLEQHQGPVYMSEKIPSVQNCLVYPFHDMAAEFGPYHWTSSMAYMIAMAIKMKPRAIGLWGIDMAAHTEWASQRPACQHFLGLAASMGIKIVIPLESDLLQPTTPYGIIENHPRHAKLLIRRQELANRMGVHQSQVASHSAQMEFCKGALDNLDYILACWTDDPDPGLKINDAVSRAAMVAGRPAPLEAAANRFAESDVPPPLDLDPPVEPPRPVVQAEAKLDPMDPREIEQLASNERRHLLREAHTRKRKANARKPRGTKRKH
jgi:hypothetical protein